MLLVLDFGAQYTQLIARRVRECSVYCEIVPHNTPIEALKQRHPRGLIFSGGPSSVYDSKAPTADPGIYPGVPVLGICYGQQLYGGPQLRRRGTARRAQRVWPGRTDDPIRRRCFWGSVGQGTRQSVVWQSYGDKVLAPPPGFQVVATTASAPIAAMANAERRLYGVQFHPEWRTRPSVRNCCAIS